MGLPLFARKKSTYLQVTTSLKLDATSTSQETFDSAQLHLAELKNEYSELCATGDGELRIPRDLRKANSLNDDIPVEDTFFKTENAYLLLGWFTSIRLFIVRLVRILILRGHTIATALTNITKYGGLSYGLELAADLLVMGKTVLMPSPQETTGYLDRLISVFLKGDRPMRMLNAAAWFSVNLACLYVTGGLSTFLSLGLFAFDVCVDAYKVHRENKKHESVLEDLDAKMTTLQTERDQLGHYDFDRRGVLTKAPINAQLQEKDREIRKLSYLKSQVVAQQKEINKTRLYLLAATSVILVGMLCFFFPPAPIFAFIGAGLAFGGGFLGGLGRRLYLLGKSKLATLHAESKAAVAGKSSENKPSENQISESKSSEKKPEQVVEESHSKVMNPALLRLQSVQPTVERKVQSVAQVDAGVAPSVVKQVIASSVVKSAAPALALAPPVEKKSALSLAWNSFFAGSAKVAASAKTTASVPTHAFAPVARVEVN